MKPFTDLLPNPVADALGWTLLHAVWQGFALVLPTAVVLYLLRHRSSTFRYNAGVSALVIQLLVSVVTFCWYYEPTRLMPSVAAPAVAQALPVRWLVLAQPSPWHQQVQFFLESHLSQFVFVYLLGVSVFALRLVGGWVYLQRLSQTAVRPATATLTELTARLRLGLAIRTVVRVRESARIAVPMVVSVLKPVLLLPIGLITQLTPHQLEAVLAHELAHVKRHDYAVNLLQSLMEVLYFFHPALWWLSARVREEREHCCDDLAVRACGGDGRTLAQALARIEELRLMEIAPTPALAMAFATRRQHLLDRVRRVLGVPTRPMVSNGSLAGLTLATILLVSASVLAVQQPDKEPKPKQARPKSTQRFSGVTSGNRIEYGLTAGRMTDVIWNKRQLPKARVQQLQQQLDRVLAGQLNLDDVKQPDRDILLTIIEKNVAFDAGMKALSEGMAQINYQNIEVNARASVPLTLTNPVVEVADSVEINDQWVKSSSPLQSPANASRSATDTSRLSAVQRELEALTRKLQIVMAERQPAIDRLSKEMTELTQKNGDWQKMTEQFERQQSVSAKQQDAFAKQQVALARKLAPLRTEMARLSLQKTAKADQLMTQKKLQSEQLEKQMIQLGEQIGKLESQMQPLAAKLEPYQQRLGLLADSISKLVEPTSELSEKIGELSIQIAEDANEQAERAMRIAEDAMRNVERGEAAPVRPVRPLRPARPPRPPKAASPVSPAVPVAPPAPAAAPKPAQPVLAPKPTPAAKPVPAPKPTPAVKSQKR